MRFILPEPDSIPSRSREKCWVLALFLSISAPLCFTNKRAASLLTLFRSERNEGMNSKICFEKVLISHSGTPLELLPARRLSLLRCTRRPCVSGNILERWHVLSAGPGGGARGWVRKHAGIMPDLKGEIWFHGLSLKREIKAGMEETGGIRKEHGLNTLFRYIWVPIGFRLLFHLIIEILHALTCLAFIFNTPCYCITAINREQEFELSLLVQVHRLKYPHKSVFM